MFFPFKVTIGEQEAKMKYPGDLFAVIERPSKPADFLKIDKEAEFLIANPQGELKLHEISDIIKLLKGNS